MMSEEYKKAFDGMIEEFVGLSFIEKNNIVIDELKELIVIVDMLCKQNGIDSKMLINKELIDIKKDNPSADDFIEAIYVYLESFKESLGRLLLAYNPIEEN